MESRLLTVKDMPEQERPRERMRAYGSSALSNAELLAVILGSGKQGEPVLQIAHRLLSHAGGLKGLFHMSIEELQEVRGIGLAKACQLAAVMELGKRVSANQEEKTAIRQPGDVAALLMPRLRHLRQEEFQAVLLDSKNQVLAIETVFVGSLNASLVHPREVFARAIRRSAAALIVAHNHPSGDPTPSREDIEVTRRLLEAGKIIGIEVLDHIIFGDGKTISMREKGLV